MYPDRLTPPPEAARAPEAQAIAPRAWALGLLVSLVASLVCAWPAMQQAFAGPWVAPDDARQHVFWMARFADPGRFPGDPIADYFQSVAPAGYKALYALLAALGLSPLLASKLLPLGLGLLAAGFAYGLATRLLPRPLAGVAAAVLLSQHLWRHDDLASGTPRAFVTPLFLGFLYFLVAGSWPGTLASVVLLGLFFPQGLLVAMGALALRALWAPEGAEPRRGLCLAALGASIASLLPFAGASGRFGPTIQADLAASWPEFQRGGRSAFFDPDPWRYWVLGRRSGLLTYAPSSSPVLLLGALLPALRGLRALRPDAIVLAQVAVASVALFALAHLSLFKLYLPSRYTMHTLWIVAAVAGGLATAGLVEALAIAARGPGAWKWPSRAAIAALLAGLVLYPGADRPLGKVGYQRGAAPGLYAFVSKLPNGARIASISPEADFLPLFSARSVVAARELAIPYQLGFYAPVRERLQATLAAQYSPDAAVLRRFVQAYGATHWLLDRHAFEPAYVSGHPLVRQYLSDGLRRGLVRPGHPSALQRAMANATVYADARVILLDAPRAAGLPSPPPR